MRVPFRNRSRQSLSYGNNQSPSLTNQSRTRVLANRSRSLGARLANLCSGPIFDFHQPQLIQFAQEFSQISLATFGLDIIFLENGGYDGRRRFRLLDQTPDRRAHGIETVIDARLQIENDRTVSQFTKQ